MWNLSVYCSLQLSKRQSWFSLLSLIVLSTSYLYSLDPLVQNIPEPVNLLESCEKKNEEWIKHYWVPSVTFLTFDNRWGFFEVEDELCVM